MDNKQNNAAVINALTTQLNEVMKKNNTLETKLDSLEEKLKDLMECYNNHTHNYLGWNGHTSRVWSTEVTNNKTEAKK